MTYQLTHKRRGSGFWIMGRAGEELPTKRLVYKGADGAWFLADADTAASLPALGITQERIPNGQGGSILTHGIIGFGAWTWTPGGEVYASTTAGVLTQTPPAGVGEFVQVIGLATKSNLIYFQPHFAPSDESNTYEGSTAYVGFDESKDMKVNYFVADGVADDVQINAAEAYVTALGGGTVELERGNFILADPILPTGSNIWYKGQGPDTFIDGDGLATGEHAFHVTGRTSTRISDMSIQTEDGGGKTSHCIFIEDGSSFFQIDNIVIVESDSDGIHVGGTLTTGGRILNVVVLDVDGNGIHVDMDGGANLLTNTLINSTDIFSAGANGMLLSDCHDSRITDNLITTAASDGIELLVDCDNNRITDNIINDNGAYGVNIAAATSARNWVMGNTFLANTTAPCLDNGTDTNFMCKEYYVARDDDNINQTPGKSITNGQTAFIAVHAPDNMQQIMSFHIHMMPLATQANANWDLATSYGGVGEANNVHAEAENAATYNVTDLQWFQLDAFEVGMFASLEASDAGGISVTVSTAGHNLMVVFGHMTYV